MEKTKKTKLLYLRKVGVIIRDFWENHYRMFFFAFLFMAIGLGFYVWRKDVYGSDWSEKQRRDYINSQNNVVNFREKEFNKVIDNVNERKQEYESKYSDIKDITK